MRINSLNTEEDKHTCSFFFNKASPSNKFMNRSIIHNNIITFLPILVNNTHYIV